MPRFEGTGRVLHILRCGSLRERAEVEVAAGLGDRAVPAVGEHHTGCVGRSRHGGGDERRLLVEEGLLFLLGQREDLLDAAILSLGQLEDDELVRLTALRSGQREPRTGGNGDGYPVEREVGGGDLDDVALACGWGGSSRWAPLSCRPTRRRSTPRHRRSWRRQAQSWRGATHRSWNCGHHVTLLLA